MNQLSLLALASELFLLLEVVRRFLIFLVLLRLRSTT